MRLDAKLTEVVQMIYRKNKFAFPNTNDSMVAPTNSNVVADEGMLRPARMSLIQLYVPLEVAQHTIAELGELGVCQFKDVRIAVN